MKQDSIYRSPEGKRELANIYDKYLGKLDRPYDDIYLQTRYGRTHVVNIGKKDSIPLVCLHGGNSNTPDMLVSNLPILEKFNVYAIDTIGHPGKSDETRLSSRDLSYGFWLLDVIDELKFNRVNIYSGSFGAGIAVRLATIAPERINRLALCMPSGIANGSIMDKTRLFIPYIRYRLKSSNSNLMKLCSTLMTRFDEDRIKLLQGIFKHMKINPEMPRPARNGELDELFAPTLVVAAKNDILFPASKVIPRAREIFPNLVLAEIIDGLHEPTEEIYNHIHRIAADFFIQ